MRTVVKSVALVLMITGCLLSVGLLASKQDFLRHHHVQSCGDSIFRIRNSKQQIILDNKLNYLCTLPIQAKIVRINSSGRIAGNYGNRGFVWDPSFGFLDLGTLGNGYTRVVDMNDFGEIVGYSEEAMIVRGGVPTHVLEVHAPLLL